MCCTGNKICVITLHELNVNCLKEAILFRLWSTGSKETESPNPYFDLQSDSISCLVLTKTPHHLFKMLKTILLRCCEFRVCKEQNKFYTWLPYRAFDIQCLHFMSRKGAFHSPS